MSCKIHLLIGVALLGFQSAAATYAQNLEGSASPVTPNAGDTVNQTGLGNLIKKIPVVNRYASQAANYVNRYTNTTAPVQQVLQVAPASVNKLINQSPLPVQTLLQSGSNPNSLNLAPSGTQSPKRSIFDTVINGVSRAANTQSLPASSQPTNPAQSQTSAVEPIYSKHPTRSGTANIGLPTQVIQPQSQTVSSGQSYGGGDRWGLSANFPLPKPPGGDEADQFAFPLAQIETTRKNSTQGQLEAVEKYYGLGGKNAGKGVNPRRRSGVRG